MYHYIYNVYSWLFGKVEPPRRTVGEGAKPLRREDEIRLGEMGIAIDYMIVYQSRSCHARLCRCIEANA